MFRTADKFSTSERLAREIYRGLFLAPTHGKKMVGKKIKQVIASGLVPASSSSCQTFSCHQIVARSIGYNHL
ncbi:MAG: hypothetical protein K8R36_09770 [Planctomycetales bacterium]|nr:hypothetical protein [Planctomycetales bacterium]